MDNYEIQENFLNKLAETYTKFDISYIEDLISKNFKYSSMWVFQELKGKSAYLCYLTKKLESMKQANVKNRFIMMYKQGDGQPMLMCSQKTPEGDRGVFIASVNKSGKIDSLNLMASSLYSLGYKDKAEFDKFMKS